MYTHISDLFCILAVIDWGSKRKQFGGRMRTLDKLDGGLGPEFSGFFVKRKI
jgi:hypothetical protein